MRKRIYLYFSIFFLIIFCLVFYYEKYRIPIISNDLQDIETTKVGFVISDIPRGTVITEDLITNNIEFRNIDSNYVYQKPLVEHDELLGKKASMNIPVGMYLMEDFFVSQQDVEGKILYSFPVTSHNAVARKIKPGDNVAVRVRYPDNTPSEVIIPAITIEDLTDSAGVSVLAENNQGIDWVIAWVAEEELSLLEMGRKHELFLTLHSTEYTEN